MVVIKLLLQGVSHLRRRGLAFSGRVVKYWNKLPASVVTAASVIFFQDTVGESLDRSLSPSQHRPFPYPQPPSHLHTTHSKLSSLYVTQLPALYMWFLQAHCGLLFTIINHNHLPINFNLTSFSLHKALNVKMFTFVAFFFHKLNTKRVYFSSHILRHSPTGAFLFSATHVNQNHRNFQNKSGTCYCLGKIFFPF